MAGMAAAAAAARCMNAACGAPAPGAGEWRKGWPLRSGGFAVLCDKCGYASPLLPPAEGRGRNQLLPRHWPRITDQELQQISGDSNSTIVPLFEKVLSASDAGRIGRLVLPKACAEAYFPPISQPEGRPLTIQDAKGKEWHFQFRFWPNNNSRMYVLEGVTPCIQSLQLQAGDTVTFSRIEPGGKLVMGFRKATNNVNLPIWWLILKLINKWRVIFKEHMMARLDQFGERLQGLINLGQGRRLQAPNTSTCLGDSGLNSQPSLHSRLWRPDLSNLHVV